LTEQTNHINMSGMQAVIRAVDFAVPSRRMSNEDFSAFLDTSDEWIRSHTGIGNRHIAEPSVATSDLAVEACTKVLSRAGVAAEDIDLILIATATGDFLGFPSVACIVQDRLGAKKAAAMDVVAGCTGFIYALETARNFVHGGGAKNVLVAGAEILSRITNWKDRNTCVLFGDGAGAVLVSADPAEGNRGVLQSVLRSDGSGARLLERTEGGTRFPFTDGVIDPERAMLKMDGRQVYNFAVKVVSEGIVEMMERNNLGPDDISWIVPHQANVRIIEAAAKRSKIPMSKFFMNIEEYANTSAASIPIALSEMVSKGLLRPGNLIMTFGFGSGLTYGGNLIRW
jgi:3-oxoacyl-[acyl-carrier-protein] synthase III